MSDDKTRLLSADEAARLIGPQDAGGDRTRMLSADELGRLMNAGAEPKAGRAGGSARPAANAPRFVGDKIVFFCANGHRIVVGRDLAGKRGNCSKQGCGVPVVIPSPPGSAAVAPPDGASAEARAMPSGMDVEPAGGADPPDLGGLAFELGTATTGDVPVPAEAPADEAAWRFPTDAEPGTAEAVPAFGVEAVPAAGDAWAPFDAEDIDHPTARLVARLWQERAHGGIVEVHLLGGSVILPEWYDPRWSCGTHALFAAPASDGKSLTLTAVAWDQIQKVVVRQVEGTPEGMFQG